MKITILGEPIPKARPRFFTQGGRKLAYNSQSTQESEFAWKLKAAKLEAKFNASADAYEIDLRFFFRPPPDKDKNAKLWGLIAHTSRPDLDNLEKFVLDCANKILYYDDAQIARLSSSKHYSINPRTEINIVTKKTEDVTPEIKRVVKYFSPSELDDFFKDIQSIKDLHGLANPQDIPQERLQSTADTLIQFAKKHGDKLAKIAK